MTQPTKDAIQSELEGVFPFIQTAHLAIGKLKERDPKMTEERVFPLDRVISAMIDDLPPALNIFLGLVDAPNLRIRLGKISTTRPVLWYAEDIVVQKMGDDLADEEYWDLVAKAPSLAELKKELIRTGRYTATDFQLALNALDLEHTNTGF